MTTTEFSLSVLFEHGIDHTLMSGEVVHSRWESRADWHGYRLEGWGEIAEAIGWECRSCRPDVGWVKWDTAIRDFDTHEVTIHIECGHCGDTTFYNEQGDQLEGDW